jgi:hypothetical protein
MGNIRPSAADALFVVVNGIGVGVGCVIIGYMTPSPANVEAESKRLRTPDTKSCCSFFMVFPAKVKLQSQAERPVWGGINLALYSHLFVSHAVENAVKWMA